MCGKEDRLFKTLIEGVELTVCEECARFGTVIREAVPEEIAQKPKEKEKKLVGKEQKEEEIIEVIVSDYGNLIKSKRENLGLKQEELAQKIAEKESLIHNIESEKFEPNIKLARKLERFLRIKLVEQQKVGKCESREDETKEMTLGDLIKIKKRGN